MSIFGKKEGLSEADKKLVQACAKDMFGKVWRAEGKAQATLAMKAMVPKLEAMLARERGDSNRKLALMADQLSKMVIIVSVLQELVVNGGANLDGNGHSPEALRHRRAKLDELCTIKQVAMQAVGGKA